MVLRYHSDVADSAATCSHRNEHINLGEGHNETVKSSGLIGKHLNQTEKIGHRHGRQSTQHETKRKEKGQSSFSTRAFEYRTTKDVKPRQLAPKNQVKFQDDQKDDCSERRIQRPRSLGQTSSRRASLLNNLLSSEEASYPVSNYSLDFGFTISIFNSGSAVDQLHSDANHTLQQEKKEAKQKFPNSGAQASGKSTKRPAESSSVPHKKSRRAKSHNDLEEADGDDGSGDDKKEEKFACPFYRKDPLRFLGCMNLRLVSISIVKQHLKRRHAANPDPDGSRYQEDLEFSPVSGNHKAKASHTLGKTEGPDSIPPQKLEALKLRSDRRISSTDQWHEIWVLLFGKSDITPKPLLDGVVKEMTSIIRDIWSKDGDQIVAKHIQTRGMPVCPDQLLSLLPDLLNSVEDRFEDKPVGANSNQQIAGTKRPAFKITTEKVCGYPQNSGDPFQTPYYMPEMSEYTPVSTSASFTRNPSTPIFGVEGDSEDPFRVPHHMPHLSIYNPISTSASLTRDFRTSVFEVENSDDLRSVGGVFDSQSIPYIYSPTTSPVYPEPINLRGMTDSDCDPWGEIGRLPMETAEMIEAQQYCLELP